ncbi:hypothetical protein HY025_06350 [Candidatus Daviesbacteria bacterium]|nr:hypothetical protein [Candidatus Daviesbacteria bacterium]
MTKASLFVLSFLVIISLIFGGLLVGSFFRKNSPQFIQASRHRELLRPVNVSETTPYFDDSTNQIKLGNSYYEITLSKTNGSIISLTDKARNSLLNQGSDNGCLWKAVFTNANISSIDGCSYTNNFSYSWDSSKSSLILKYTQPSHQVDTQIILTASSKSYFDLNINLQNNSGGNLTEVLLPNSLSFSDSEVSNGYGSFSLPGIRLEKSFFTGHHSFNSLYPGLKGFGNFLAVNIGNSSLALYTINPNGPIQPVRMGFSDNSQKQKDTFLIDYDFQTWIANKQTYTAPAVRIRIGQTIKENSLSYRTDNAIDNYQNISDKVGVKFPQLARSIFIKADKKMPFSAWSSNFGLLPKPALLSPADYTSGGFDTHYPDFLPPDPSYGSSADFQAAINAAHSNNMLVMPYINPTRWTSNSQTLAHLSVADLAVLDQKGQPVYESYDKSSSLPQGKTGFLVSPTLPLAKQILTQIMGQWHGQGPNAVTIDFLFEDQIGSRAFKKDFNPKAQGVMSYADGWLDHIKQYSSWGINEEQGYDKLAQNSFGFHGSALFFYPNINDDFGGADNWNGYPLALWMMGDKVLFYQHNLSGRTMSDRKEILTWNLAFGTMLSYRWQMIDESLQSKLWVKFIADLQQLINSKAAGVRLTDFADLADYVTESKFPAVSIIANWDTKNSYLDQQGSSIAPSGFLASTNDASVQAGIFNGQFNQTKLSSGDHYLLIKRDQNSLIIEQALGLDTPLAINIPSDLVNSNPQVWALDSAGKEIKQISFQKQNNQILFTYSQKQNNQDVFGYEISFQ